MINWLDNRTGIRHLLSAVLFEKIPGGSRWRYVWGSTLTFTFFVQVVTGIILWMAYSPSVQTAWESVFYIQYEMSSGWLLRGVHHYTAQAMTILLVLHLMQVIIDGAYRAPREINFWFGIALLNLVLALSLTGYLLPWDQKGYWATKVTTSLMAATPIIGPGLEKLVVGGAEYGHHTLTRFFAFHAGVLPAAVVALIAGHIYLFRRHGITPKQPLRKPDAMFWPDQVLKDAVACLAVFATILLFVLKGKLYGDGHLGAPAEPTEPYAAARPEWYFLFLFQFLKYFPGEREIYGTLVIPGAVMGLICLMPFIGRWRVGHFFNIFVMVLLLGGIGVLTYLAVNEDRKNPEYVQAAAAANRAAERVKTLAQAPTGIPVEGAVALLRNDPLTQGPKLFAIHCASCHRYAGRDGLGTVPGDEPSAADLKGFASREWLTKLISIDHITSDAFFGKTAFSEGKMAKFVERKVAQFDGTEKEQLRKAIIALSAEARLPQQADMDQAESSLIEEGKNHLLNDIGCADCHEFHFEDEDATGPDLTGYGSKEWLTAMIGNPTHERFYGDKNDRMPAFATEGILNSSQISLLADWLRNDWYEPEALAATAE
ncbi:MAG: Menaquinol-cytochrome c reductase cytochrome b subunit [Verrucomicrobia subdivision 3 bacterium]|nr:Menaquinol-cytochrome c reductase cytochrome b subunit [Limisphaerales bacterium]MCS1414381.1 Menaquinol-cytochrome c reductase cytochrome b subunit [Limisphaerales bacterium]